MGEYNEDGTRKEVERVNLPFQVIESLIIEPFFVFLVDYAPMMQLRFAYPVKRRGVMIS